jgi:hypothetical protein
MRLSGIVDADNAGAVQRDAVGFIYVSDDERRWNAMSRQIWQVARL